MSNSKSNKNKSSNKNSTYKPKSATMKASSSNKTISASEKIEDNKKIVKADVIKNGNEIKQKTVTTKLNDDNKSDNTVKSENKSNSETEKNQTKDLTQSTTQKQSHMHKPSYPNNWWLWAIIIIGSCIIAGAIATLLGGKMFNFRDHELPPAMVPDIVFPIAWALIYILIGVSAFLVFLSPNQTEQTRRGDIIWFCINLFLNILWPLFFFRLDWLIASTILCGLIVISAIITCYRFYYRNLAGGICYTFYTLWLLYAFYLNLAICLINA